MRSFFFALRACFFAAALALCLANGRAVAGAYTLVEGLERFHGSTAAWNLLESNGFVVADPSFKQIFQPYTEGPLPCFITADSAWHTYHVLMEEGLRQLDTAQSRRLTNFSRQLFLAATTQAKSDGQDFADLAAYAAVAVALQDVTFQSSLPPAAKTVFQALRSGGSQAEAGIGFPLSTAAFRARSVGAAAIELNGYSAARQWYATVVFRLSDARETRLALSLAWLIAQNPDLLYQWKQLSNPYDALRAPAEGGTVPAYLGAAADVLGDDFTSAALRARLPEIQKALARQIPASRLNDQLLPAGQSTHFGELTKGFRLLPPRLLPDDLYLAGVVAPKIPERLNPSGLDFLAASPELRSPASVRALRQFAGDKAAAAAQKAELGDLPESLYGEEIRLLAKLQQPLPASAPPAFRSAAWADQQLWTQLGAWAEQRHSGAAQRRLVVPDRGYAMLPSGVVAPYPAFFAGLANLSREGAGLLEKNVARRPFDSQAIAKAILAAIPLWRGGRGGLQAGVRTTSSDATQQFSRFWARYSTEGRRVTDPEPTLDELQKLAQRCSTNSPSDSDAKTLVLYYQSDQYASAELTDFAGVCDRLSQLARKNLLGASLTEEDQEWIRGYGLTLAGFHSYAGNSIDNLRDDFPIVSRVFASPAGGKITYAGLARPQALYIILPSEGKLRLFRGAVLAYREFSQPAGDLVDDTAWRRMITRGATPAPPAFTSTFFSEKTAADLIASIREGLHTPDADERDAGTDPPLDQLKMRASDADLPALIKLLAESFRTRSDEIADPLAEIIGNLNWRTNLPQLLQIIRQADDADAFNTITSIFTNKPDAVDTAFLSANFAKEPPRLRRLYCVLLGSVQPGQPDFETLARAFTDADDSVRWQACLAMSKTKGTDPRKTSLLLGRLDDTNEYVAAAAVYVLGKIRATNAAPALLDKLNRRLSSPPPSAESLRQQSQAIVGGVNNFNNYPMGMQLTALDTEGLEARLRQDRVVRTVSIHVNVNVGGLPGPFTLVDSLIETLGVFRCQPAQDKLFTLLPGDHDESVVKALLQLAPDRLAERIITNACDRAADPSVRDRILSLLPDNVATNHVAELSPLLDDATVVPSPAGFATSVPAALNPNGVVMAGAPVGVAATFVGPPNPNDARRSGAPPGAVTAVGAARGQRAGLATGEWRICDRAMLVLSPLLGQRLFITPSYPVQQRDQFIIRLRDIVKKGAPVPPVAPVQPYYDRLR